MDLIFEETEKKIVTVAEKIIIGGKPVGYVESYEDEGKVRFHAVINMPSGCGLSSLAQGHANTKEEAVFAAINSQICYAQNTLIFLEKMRSDLNAD